MASKARLTEGQRDAIFAKTCGIDAGFHACDAFGGRSDTNAWLDHYPQRVRYSRDGSGLKARISILDGSQPVDFSWRMMGSN